MIQASKYIVTALLLALLSACSGPDRDSDLESSVLGLVDAEEVFAISTFGNVVVTVSSDNVFEMTDEGRESLAEEIAVFTYGQYRDAQAVVIGFAAMRPEALHVAYAWRVIDGNLQRVDELGGQIVKPGQNP